MPLETDNEETPFPENSPETDSDPGPDPGPETARLKETPDHAPAAGSSAGGRPRPAPPDFEEDKNLELGCEAVRLAAGLIDWNEEYQQHGLYSSLAFHEAQPTSGAQTLHGGIAALRAAARLVLQETRHLAPGLGETPLPEELEPYS